MERNEEKWCYLIPQKQPPSGARSGGGKLYASYNERASSLEDVEVEFSTTEVQEDHCGGYQKWSEPDGKLEGSQPRSCSRVLV